MLPQSDNTTPQESKATSKSVPKGHDWQAKPLMQVTPKQERPATHNQEKFGALFPDWSTWRQGPYGEMIVDCKCRPCGRVGAFQTINLFAGQSLCDVCLGLSDKPSGIPH